MTTLNGYATATPEEIVAEARTWLQTRWSHQQRLKGVATDCAGIVIGVAQARLGFTALIPAYSRQPSHDSLLRMCREHMQAAALPALGRVAVMKFQGEPQHMGILGDYPHGGLSLIHAYAKSRKVVEHRLDEIWLARIVAVFILRGVVE